MAVTEFQERVYEALRQIPRGQVTSYLTLSKALGTSPRAIGGALRNNPFAPEIPCHRVISNTGHIGGYLGDWHNAPSGINRDKKRNLLKEEGVEFNREDVVIQRDGLWFNDFDTTRQHRTRSQRQSPA